uniref:Protein kinase domain-containing protein n=1 Tax=Noctiluca scintillans TaxID=2966 RepID=A0A7S0ZQH2_NOCSC|mmetsp:Transcript_14478/g.39630  ORF Transcript_14478/g.39630 Transcript_14478/m.39630 type:complete len:898 (+) Transcript_14478:67-2760(+)|eukprot:CAMPEP_0194488970 /NCGR_PEP_ID=MMETSP0253-20130528/8698_1 /TAXON_ID=2966 /ORGANISM="Noctiluca scintillans" /LENGTH=897 /DNA_ID=CAMNT_0039329393 /DNA_START=48 /DNA_END=2741 /DNA_ORIENTATION=-
MAVCDGNILPSEMADFFNVPPQASLSGASFSKVFKVHDKLTGEGYAVKVLSRDEFFAKRSGDLIENEFLALKRCFEEGCSRHIVHLKSVVEENGLVFFRLDLCETDLAHWINLKPACKASEQEVMRYAAQTFVGLADLHSLAIMHRNINPEHLLLVQGTLKITGFGSCATLDNPAASPAGSPPYMAPEMLTGVVQTPAVDLWSAGYSLLRFLCGPNMKGLGVLARQQRLREDERVKALSSPCIDMLQQLLEFEPDRRIKAFDCISHEWMHNIIVPQAAEVSQPIETLLPSCIASELDLEELKIPLLGAGAFAKIFTVREKSTGMEFAMKLMERSFFAAQGLEEQMIQEVEAMRLCVEHNRCEHVVYLWNAREVEGRVFLRMEMCHTNLHSHVQSLKGIAPESAVASWTEQLFSGLADIHHVGFIHRDIKLENLLLSLDGRIKIADFGWCVRIEESPTSLAGTWQTMPPEMLEERPQTVAVDVWAAGCSIIQALVGRPFVCKALEEGPTGLSATDPWGATAERRGRFLRCITEALPLLDDQRPPHLSPECWNFLNHVLARVEDRFTVPQALQHQWMSSFAVAPLLLPSCMLDDFEQLEVPLLGEGVFAKIFRVTEKATRTDFAVKMLERSLYGEMGLEHHIAMEIDSLRRCCEETSCQNLLKLLDVREEEGKVFLRSELCFTDLLKYVNTLPGSLAPEQEVEIWARQLIAGLSEIHGVGLVHRDIKPDNLMLMQDGILKIVDFGWCAPAGSPGVAGTWHMMAPEVLEGKASTFAVDMWSTGCTLINLLVGRRFLNSSYHLEGLSTTERSHVLLTEISEVCPLLTDQRPVHLSPACWAFLQRALTRRDSDRITVSVAKRHIWIEAKSLISDQSPSSSSGSTHLPSDVSGFGLLCADDLY